MFTGLVTDIGEILSVEPRGELRRIAIACHYPLEGIALGASIACSGPCLTAVGLRREGARTVFEVDAAAETLARTTAGEWAVGRRINLERSLKIGDEFGGHIVTGHVDGVATIVSRDDFDGMSRFWIEAPHDYARFIAEKGSVALDGTSLTVNAVEGDRFSVLIIPHTLAVTTWGGYRAGDRLNLEVDLMARYAARLAEAGSRRPLIRGLGSRRRDCGRQAGLVPARTSRGRGGLRSDRRSQGSSRPSFERVIGFPRKNVYPSPLRFTERRAPPPQPSPASRERGQVAPFIESARHARRIPLPRSGGG